LLNPVVMDDASGLMDAAAHDSTRSARRRRNQWIRSIGAVAGVTIILISARRIASPTTLQGVRSTAEVTSKDAAVLHGPAAYSWLSKREAVKYASLADRIPPPDGFARIPAPAGSFASWLRHLPVLPADTPVTTGKRKVVLTADDQQLAAAIALQPRTEKALAGPNMLIRLRAEYCWAAQHMKNLGFHFTSGHLASWDQWAEGRRPTVHGKAVSFAPAAERDESRESFCSYLETIFEYSSAYSVFDDTTAVGDGSIAPGDIFLRPGKGPCSLLVIDVVTNERGDVCAMLGDAGTPAQTFHVIKSSSGSAWFPIVQGEELTIQSKRLLRMRDLRRWK
jgi:hypothetical protein